MRPSFLQELRRVFWGLLSASGPWALWHTRFYFPTTRTFFQPCKNTTGFLPVSSFGSFSTKLVLISYPVLYEIRLLDLLNLVNCWPPLLTCFCFNHRNSVLWTSTCLANYNPMLLQNLELGWYTNFNNFQTPYTVWRLPWVCWTILFHKYSFLAS